MQKDIFDRIMGLPLLRRFEEPFQKHREGILYLLFGGLTTLVNLALSAFFWYVLKWEEWYWGDFAVGTFLGNLISIVSSILFAYVTNRIWVFRSEVHGARGIAVEMAKFFAGRAATLVIEIGGVQLTTMLFPGDSVILFIGKLVTQVLVILLNFVFSKIFVFKNDKKTENKIEK
ncbi:MAG: GtrA family protein [Eubacterium sp.]|nr:GtrA family protein [Eubacterium sp.]